MGTVLDRWSAFLVAVFTRSSFCAGSGAAGAGFAASPSALRVALTTCVARDAFSRIDKPLSADAVAALARLDGALEIVFVRDRVEFVALDPVLGLFTSSTAAEVSSLGSSKLLSRASVAGVHVATDEIALRTASAWASCVSMDQNVADS